jgi:hypothetical protein
MRRPALFRLTVATAAALVFLGYPGHGSPGVFVPLDNPPQDGGSNAFGTAETGFDNVEMSDPGLEGKLSVVSVGSDRTNTNLLSIFATLKNLTSSSLMIEAETLYKDGNGAWLDGGKGSWLVLEIKPHEEMEYRSASLSEDAQDFLVRIRRPGTP